MKIFNYTVTENDKNQRLDTYVASLDLDVSRSMAQKIIKQGNVSVNGKIEKESYKTKTGDKLEIKLEEPKETTLKA